jgi:hypothetical protein
VVSAVANPPGGADRADEDRPVYRGTQLEWLHDFADCMRQSGIAVTVDESVPTFEPAGDLHGDQIDAWNEAFDECRKMLGNPVVEGEKRPFNSAWSRGSRQFRMF